MFKGRQLYLGVAMMLISPPLLAAVQSVPLEFFALSHEGLTADGQKTYPLGYHMTADPAEIQVLKEAKQHDRIRAGYLNIQGAVYVFNKQIPGTIPLYRYRSRVSSDHFFTISQSEGNQAVERFDYVPEGICCYVFATQIPGSLPLYRLQKDALHFYTATPL